VQDLNQKKAFKSSDPQHATLEALLDELRSKKKILIFA
jgi:hypothetical protein